MKLTKEDKAWSLKVKKRAKFKCEICGSCSINPKTGKKIRLNSHHIISRRYKKLKLVIKNGISACYYCHMHLIHRNTIVGAELIKKAIGTRRYNWLLKQYNKGV